MILKEAEAVAGKGLCEAVEADPTVSAGEPASGFKVTVSPALHPPYDGRLRHLRDGFFHTGFGSENIF